MQDYITLGIKIFNKDYFLKPSNRSYINKPYGGLWGCKYVKDLPSAWAEWCRGEHFQANLNYGILYNLKEDARIYTIDDYSDLEEIIKRYPNEQDQLLLPSKTIDYVEIMKEYDAIELTDRGQWKTRLSHPYSLYGWDMESILILNPDIIINDRVWKKERGKNINYE